jgi:hypothetical protein
MAEIKNSFTSSKMNQDLDDRLVPSNEYREGRNISIISSDSSNTGSIENILGNDLVADLIINFDNLNFEIIGYTYNQTAGILYVMATNYTDTSRNQLDNTQSYMWATDYANYEDTLSRIIQINLNNKEVKTLVSGKFLNFSKTHPITGINLIENLLFWTDNRNQPRKINVNTAYNDGGYYFNEDQISVAKYAPFSSIEFINEGACTMRDVTSEFLPDGEDNLDYNADYAGDPSYLLDKFVRFSYRFRFDDGEYSILAPFSQIAFIPQQDGSFITDGALSDENEAYRSSIVSFMKNKVSEIGLIIPLPTIGSSLKALYKVTEIDIIYKESDSLAIQILDTILAGELSSVPTSYYNYDYQSRKPKTTLSNDQLLRVYDKVPVRALAQETSGGRIIYGNYIDKHTPPTVIDYKIGINAKLVDGDVSIEYPLHTVKQNRNYQVGIILSDRFGRQSDVILSSITNSQTTDGIFFGGSSFYSPYLDPNPNVLTFFGNSIKVLFDNFITSTREPLNDRGVPATGEPGLYTEGSFLESFSVINTTYALVPGTYIHTPALVLAGPLSGVTPAYFDVVVGLGGVVSSIILNESVNEVIIGTEALLYAVPRSTTVVDGRPIIRVNSVTKENPTGWYSYKIVVKQTQQEYYNVYAPGALSGYPATTTTTFPTSEDTKTSHVVLFSDNINKVPRDLSEVGPDQKQYRSSIKLFGRVENDSAASNAQFIPTKEGFSVPTLANASDLTMSPSDITSDGNFYQLNTNPIIGRISTNGVQFGVTNATMEPYLAVLETNPVVSNIDIYWETSSTGIISELNDLIAQTFEGAYSFIDINYSQFENQNPSGTGNNTGEEDCKYVTDWFYPVTYTNTTLVDTTADLVIVTNANNVEVEGFALETSVIGGIDKYRIKIIDNFYYNIASNLNQFNFILAVTDPTSSTTNNITIKGDLNNIAPTINPFTLPKVYTGTIGIYTFSGVNGSFGNVPSIGTPTSTPTSDLKWTFEDGTETFTGGIGVSEFTLTINANSIPGYLAVTAGNPKTLETPTIVLTDSGNAIDTATLSLDFRPGEFDPKEFNLDFNL